MPHRLCLPQAQDLDRLVDRFPILHLILVMISLLLLSVSSAGAAEVSLTWDPNHEEDLAGYRVYWGPQSRDYSHSADIGDQVNYTVPNLTEGQVYFFAVTAYDVNQQESDYSVELAFAVPIADTDQDGLSDTDEIQLYGTDPLNADTDGDTMNDGWEVAEGLDPLRDDADDDSDGDGFTNLQEYIAWLQSGNHRPDRPVIAAPSDGAANVVLTPVLQAGPFQDPDVGDVHLSTHWQISKSTDFQNLVFELLTDEMLTSVTLPESLLDGNTTYYWRVKVLDNHYTDSFWSSVAQFTTQDASTADGNGNGIPDSQEIVSAVDLDHNGVPDQSQADIKCLNAAEGNVQIGVMCQTAGATIDKMEALVVSPQLQSGVEDLNFPAGLISFRIHVASPGDTVAVRVLYSEPIPTGSWFKHTPSEGWLDYSPQVIYDADRYGLTFFVTDGGADDADGTVNGVIVDPVGVATGAGVTSASSAGEGGGGGGCFIETAGGNPFVRMFNKQ